MCDILSKSKTFMSPLIKKKAFSVLEPREKKRIPFNYGFILLEKSFLLEVLARVFSFYAQFQKKSVLVTGLLKKLIFLEEDAALTAWIG